MSANAWGSRGVRYDEDCAGCHRMSAIDNDSELCKRCHGEPAKTNAASPSEPYRRGLGQGFGSGDDGDI